MQIVYFFWSFIWYILSIYQGNLTTCISYNYSICNYIYYFIIVMLICSKLKIYYYILYYSQCCRI